MLPSLTPDHRHPAAVFIIFSVIIHHHHHILPPVDANPNQSPVFNQVGDSSSDNDTTKDVVSSFQPSLAVVLGVLSIMFSLTFILLLYARCCNRSWAESSSSSPPGGGAFSSSNRRRRAIFNSFSADEITTNHGIDKKLIKSLPVFRFGSLKGSKDGLECSVCLSRFEQVEILRLLPKCKHAFHIDCVDRWLENHSTCPLCRHRVTAEDVEAYHNHNHHQSSRVFLSGSSGDRVPSGGIVAVEDDQKNNNGDLNPPADSNLNSVELFVEREEAEDDNNHLGDGEGNRAVSRSSSIVSLGCSLRRILAGKTMQQQQISSSGSSNTSTAGGVDHSRRALHKHNHTIVVSDVMLKNRWSNVSSSDLMFLNSEMLQSSARFSNTDSQLPPVVAAGEQVSVRLQMERGDEFQKIKEEMERKRWIELRTAAVATSEIMKGRDSNASTTQLLPPDNNGTSSASGGGEDDTSPAVVPGRRSVSEITVLTRFRDFDWKSYYKERENSAAVDGGGGGGGVEAAEQKRKLWFPIARKTVEWFANREKHKMNHHHHRPALTDDV